MSVLNELRQLTPQRTLTLHEGRYIAERQATRLRQLLDHSNRATLPNQAIENLPRIRVYETPDLNSSGFSGWHTPTRTWHIYLNAHDDHRRRRFTLLHEYKHIIDRPFTDQLRTFGAFHADDQAELICDHFASCALMPRPIVKHLWANGNRDIRQLARTFDVTPAAMRVRLSKLGLTFTSRQNRHGDTNHPFTTNLNTPQR